MSNAATSCWGWEGTPLLSSQTGKYSLQHSIKLYILFKVKINTWLKIKVLFTLQQLPIYRLQVRLKNRKETLIFKYFTTIYIYIHTFESWAREIEAEDSSCICSAKNKCIFKFYNQNIARVNLYCSLKICTISSACHWKRHFQPTVICICSE